MKKIIVAAIGIIAIILIAYYYLSSSSQSSEDAVAVSVERLLKDYNASEESGDAAYLNKRLVVTGTLSEVSESNGSMLLLLRGDEGNYVSCSPAKGAGWEKFNLKPGDTVTITGVCTGMLMDVLLSDCTIQQPIKK